MEIEIPTRKGNFATCWTQSDECASLRSTGNLCCGNLRSKKINHGDSEDCGRPTAMLQTVWCRMSTLPPRKIRPCCDAAFRRNSLITRFVISSLRVSFLRSVAMIARYALWLCSCLCVCPSVRPPVTSRYCTVLYRNGWRVNNSPARNLVFQCRLRILNIWLCVISPICL